MKDFELTVTDHNDSAILTDELESLDNSMQQMDELEQDFVKELQAASDEFHEMMSSASDLQHATLPYASPHEEPDVDRMSTCLLDGALPEENSKFDLNLPTTQTQALSDESLSKQPTSMAA